MSARGKRAHAPIEGAVTLRTNWELAKAFDVQPQDLLPSTWLISGSRDRRCPSPVLGRV